MKRILQILALTLMLGLLAACQPKESILTEADNGQPAAVKMGEKIAIELGANPSTGYTWEVAEVDPSVLKQVGETEYQSASSNPAPGSGGTQTLRFEPIGAGTTTLKLIYHRPFETDTPPVDTFTIQVTVAP